MKRLFRLLGAALLGAALLAPMARAIEINVYVDAAPNAYGSPDWATWWDDAKAAAVAGTFVNMDSSFDSQNSGTNFFHIKDANVYSIGDLGRRLHFVYWLPDTTIAELTAANFEFGVDLIWAGTTYSDWAYFPDEWVTPLSWEQTAQGVIGSAGVAFWAGLPSNTPEAVAADIAFTQAYTDAFSFRVRSDGMEATTLLTVTQRVPDPSATIVLLVLGLGALAIQRRGRSES